MTTMDLRQFRVKASSLCKKKDSSYTNFYLWALLVSADEKDAKILIKEIEFFKKV